MEKIRDYMAVSENRGTPKSSILIGFSIINHPFWKHPYGFDSHPKFLGINLDLSWKSLGTFWGRFRSRDLPEWTPNPHPLKPIEILNIKKQRRGKKKTTIQPFKKKHLCLLNIT